MNKIESIIAPVDGYDSPEGLYPIRFVDGEFNGVVARIGNFKENDQGQLVFDVEILEGKIEDSKQEAFEDLINQFIREAVEEAMRQYKKEGTNE